MKNFIAKLLILAAASCDASPVMADIPFRDNIDMLGNEVKNASALSLKNNTGGIINFSVPGTTAWDWIYPDDAGTNGYVLTTDGSGNLSWEPGGGGGSGNVVGPALATANALVRFDLTTGKLIKNSVAVLGDTGNLSGIADLSVTGTTTLNTGLSGPLKATAGAVSASAIALGGSEVTGTLPASKVQYLTTTTSDVQTQLNGKEPTVNLNVNRAVVSNGSGALAAATTTAAEIGYVNGVTSAIQTQINGKEPTITTLPVSKGGTNSGTALNNDRVMQSSGGAIVEAPAITASKALASNASGIPVASTTTATQLGYLDTVTSNVQTQIDSKGPPISLTASRAVVSDVSGNLSAATTTSAEIGYVNGVTSNIQTQLNAKEPTISVLPIAKGGTNSGTTLNNNRVIASQTGAISELPAITASRALASDANGLPVAATTTATELGYVNGVTSALQTQLNGKEPTITTLPISKGGTNSGVALNNNRVIQSLSGGIVEAPAITASKALASDTNGIPVASATTATELGYVNGVTSAIQTQLNAKEPTITVLPVAKGGTNSSTALNNNRVIQSSGGKIQEAAAITASRALASDANGIPVASTTTATQLGYLSNVSSDVQTQLDTKAIGAASSTANAVPSFSGTDGKTLQNTAASLTTGGALSGLTQLDVDNVRVDGNTVSTTNSNGNLVLTPNGTGRTTTSKGIDTTAASGMRLYDTDDSNYVELKPNGTTTSNYTRTFPAAQGIANTFLKNDGSGNLSNELANTQTNLILNAFAAQDTNGYTASGAGIAVARTTTSSDLPLESVYGSALKITPASGTDYVSYCFTLPEGLASTKLQAQWFQRPLSGYASGDLKFDVYSYAGAGCTSTATRVALSTDSSAVTSIPNSTGTFRTTFDTSTTSAAPSYQIRFVRVAGTTAINFTNIYVGPGVTAQGAVVGPVQSYTPTFNGLGTVTSNLFWRQNGSNMEIYGEFTVGTAAASPAYFTLPTGYTIDTTKVGTYNNRSFGTLYALVNTGTYVSSTETMAGFYDNTNTNRINLAKSITTGNHFQVENGSSVTSSNRVVSVPLLVIPIAEWAGSGTVNLGGNGDEFVYNTDTSNADNTTAFGYGPGGIAFGSYTGGKNKTVRFQTPIQPTDVITIEVNAGTNWMPFYANNAGSLAYTTQNSVRYGMWLSQSSITDVIVGFGHYYSPTGTTFGAVGGPWAGLVTWKWRVRKSASGQAVGFGLATATQSGLYQAGQAPGITTGVDASAGNVGEYSESKITTGTNLPTTNQWGDVTSLTLTPGDWDIIGLVDFAVNGATVTAIQMGISTTSGNSGTGLVSGVNQANGLPPTATTNSSLSVPRYRVNITSNTTYYLKVLGAYSVATPKYTGLISARRVR